MIEDRYFIKLEPNGETEKIYDIGPSYTLQTLQNAVGGPTQTVGTTLGLAVKMAINEEGKRDGLPPNRGATSFAVIRSYDYVAGGAVLAVERDGELAGFSEPDAETVETVIEAKREILKEAREGLRWRNIADIVKTWFAVMQITVPSNRGHLQINRFAKQTRARNLS